MTRQQPLRWRLVYSYDSGSGWVGGTSDMSMSEALNLVDLFMGTGGSMRFFPDQDTMLAWIQHGNDEFNIVRTSETRRESRFVRVPNDVAHAALRDLYEGKFSLEALSGPGIFSGCDRWDPSKDSNYHYQRRASLSLTK